MRRLLVAACATMLVACGTTGSGLEGATTLSIGQRPILLGPVTADRAVVDDLVLAADEPPALTAVVTAAGTVPTPPVTVAAVLAPPLETPPGSATSTEGTWLASVFSLLAAPPPRPVAVVTGRAPATAPTAAPSAPSAPASGLDGILACIRAHESSGNYQATNGIYRGAYQFDQSTWESVGGSGDPVNASPSEQDHRAALLYQVRGGQPWPNARC